MNNALLFVHIPKSAGTSFRNGLEKQYGIGRVLGDYTFQAPETSSIIKSLVYQEEDLYHLGEYLDNGDAVALSGHFPINKYAHLFCIKNIVVFVREPIARIISEHQHSLRHKNYSGSLLDFAKLPKKKNLQSRYLSGLPLSSIGFVGVTECYEESLSLLQQTHGLKLPMLNKNITPGKKRYLESVEPDTVEKIKLINKKDIKLYKESLAIFKRRLDINQSGRSYVFGQYHLLPNNRLGGWAYFEDSVDIVIVNVIWSGKIQFEIKANQFNAMMNSFNSPRKGFVGFKVKLPSDADITSLECRVKTTEQLLIDMT